MMSNGGLGISPNNGTSNMSNQDDCTTKDDHDESESINNGHGNSNTSEVDEQLLDNKDTIHLRKAGTSKLQWLSLVLLQKSCLRTLQSS